MLVSARKAGGFSLVELLIVVAVLAMAAAFSLPALRGSMSAFRLRASADTVAGELDAARVMAISRGAVYEVRFTTNTVYVRDPQDPNRPPRLPKQLDEGIGVVTGPVISFQPRGTCSGGAVTVKNLSNHTTASIIVSVTGKIAVYMGSETG